jgi:hypothetical protein
MPILRTNKYAVNVPVITEDPTPGANLLFLQNECYDTNTLTHYFNKTISYFPPGTGYATAMGTGNLQNNADPWYITGGLLLAGEVTHCKHVLFNSNNDYRNVLDQSPFSSMDPTNRVKHIRYDAFGGGSHLTAITELQGSAVGGHYNWVYHKGNVFSTTTDMSTGFPQMAQTQATGYRGRMVALNTYTGNIILCADSNTTGYTPGAWQGFCYTTSTLGGGVTYPVIYPLSVGQVQNFSNQFVGFSQLTGQAIMMHNSISNDYTQNFYRYNDNNQANTVITLNAYSAIPAGTTSTGGTSWGGDRASQNGNLLPKFASSTFAPSNTASTQAFYLPYFDTVGNFQPFYYQWNQTNDFFTRLQVNTATYFVPGLSTSTLSTYWQNDGFSASSINVNYGMQRCWYNETFTYGGNRYLTFMQLHGAGGLYDTTSTMRTFVNYTVDPNNFQAITYHSSFVIPQTPKNIVWLSNDRTLMGVFTYSYFYIYTFDSTTTGWRQLASYPYQFGAVGRDSQGRIWATDNGPQGQGRIHLLLGQNVPTSITVVPTTSTYNYAGSPLPVTLNVDSFDAYGNRLASNITLTTVGSSLVLVNNSGQNVSSYTTTTNTLASTQVQAFVVGPGTTGLEANLAI